MTTGIMTAEGLEVAIAGLATQETGVPLPWEVYGYLVRGVDDACGGPGSLGSDSSEIPRPSPCP